MSAIWGVIDLTGNNVTITDAEKLDESYKNKKIDRTDRFFEGNCYLCCGIQYVTNEALKEKFPYGSKNNGLIVADVILDNRAELCKEFGLSEKVATEGIDGQILYECMIKDQNKALDKMLGAYAFAWYDYRKEEVKIVSDAVGNRSVYYLFRNGRVYFSTLLNAILKISGIKEINERWIADYLAQNDLRTVTEAEETPWKDIYRVKPGEIVTIGRSGISKRAYWNPFNVKKLKLQDDEAYKQRVLSVFGECVRSTIRDGGETGILLSGGLDSNAVTAFAAPELKRRGKKLYSFTSIPERGLTFIPAHSFYVKNEAPYILETQKMHDNLVPEFIATAQGDLWEENRKLLQIFEVPYKSIANIPWMFRTYQSAAEKGCRILLSGQYGNATISYGDFECLFYTLFRTGRWISLIKELNAFSRRYQCSRKKIVRGFLFPGRTDAGGMEECLLSKELQKYYHIAKRRQELSLSNKIVHDTYHKSWKMTYDKVALRQVGEAEIKMSLETGIIPRDPTRDRRLIELILALPQEQFTHMGRDRRLVRVYMQKLIPDMIVNDDFHRGEQGYGAVTQIRKQWQQISSQILKDFNSQAAKKYLNMEYINQCMKCSDNLLKEENEFEMTKMMYSSLLCEYLENAYEGKI